MTDDELKALVASLAVSQDRTDELIKALGARVDQIAIAQDRTDAQLAKTDAQLARTDAQLAKTEALVAQTAAKVDRLGEMYGGVSNNQGDVAEEFYYNSLAANPVLGDVRFDFIQRNTERNRAGLVNEFDLLLVNGRKVHVVEVKYKAHEKDLRRLLDVKAGVTVLQRKGDVIESTAA